MSCSCSDGKLNMVKTMLGIDAADESRDAMLNAYLEMSKAEILNWMYINYPEIPADAEFPAKYDITQLNAVVAGYNLRGGENELKHTENGVTREFNFSDMLMYIRAHVYQKVKA